MTTQNPIDHCVMCGHRDFLDERCEWCGWPRHDPIYSPFVNTSLVMLLVGILLACAIWFAGCSGHSSPVTPTAPTTPPPQPQTGTLHLSNPINATLNIYWDGHYLAQLSPNSNTDFAQQALGAHTIQWEAIEPGWWQIPGAVFCLGPNDTVRQCSGVIVCSASLTIAANVSTTAVPCAYDMRRTCSIDSTSLITFANTSTHDDEVFLDRQSRGIVHPATDPSNIQSSDIHTIVTSPGSHTVDVVHSPPPRYNVCQGVPIAVAVCEVKPATCQY